MTLSIRQGDVYLLPVLSIPATATVVPRDRDRLVLAYGEATGHAHVLDAPPAEATLLTDAEKGRFLRLVGAAPLRHVSDLGTLAPTTDHSNLDVLPGTYQVVIHREFTPSMMARPVSD